MFVSTQSFLIPGAGKVIFFLAPYATPTKRLELIIRSLNRLGYSVIAYEYSRDIFRTGEPNNLAIAIKENREHLRASINNLQAQGYKEFGFIGCSLGSFVIYNCLRSLPELTWGIMIAGGSATEAVWSFETERKAFSSKGYTKQDLEKAWRSLQYAELGDLSDKRYILITSKVDKTTPYKSALEAFDRIKQAGAEVRLIVHRRLDHRKTIIRNLLRIRGLVRRLGSRS